MGAVGILAALPDEIMSLIGETPNSAITVSMDAEQRVALIRAEGTLTQRDLLGLARRGRLRSFPTGCSSICAT